MNALREAMLGAGGEILPNFPLRNFSPFCRGVCVAASSHPYRPDLDGAHRNDSPAKKNPNPTRNRTFQTKPGSVKPLKPKPHRPSRAACLPTHSILGAGVPGAAARHRGDLKSGLHEAPAEK